MKHPRGSYDAIVVGGGHNGLVCAAYLARAGIRTVVLERRPVAGGMAATVELAPGVRAPAVADTVGRLRASVARDLLLRDHGLALVQPAVRVFAPQRDGRHVTLWGDAARTAAELRTSGLVSERDARAWPDADERLRALASALAVLLSRTPPDLTQPSIADALEGLKLGLRSGMKSRSPPNLAASGGLLRTLPMSVHDLVGEWFESEPLRAAVASRGVRYTALAPRMPGTAQVLMADSAGNDGGLAGQSVFARGGPGGLSLALTSAARSLAAEVRTDAEVARIRCADSRVEGVTLVGGEEIDAGIVVSGVDPRQTLLELLTPEAVGPRLSWRASNIRGAGATAKVNLALRELPQFAGIDAREASRRLRGRIVIAPDMAYLERAADAGKYGRLAEEPFLEATIPTLVDPGLVDSSAAGPVRHVMSVTVQAAPYRLRDATWDEAQGTLAETVLRTLEEYAPGITDLVEAQAVITPLDLERDYGVTEGHPMHVESALDQWFAWRPMHGLGRYRLPLDGLYLCGSGAHPGGGVTGGPGQGAAREILADVAHGELV